MNFSILSLSSVLVGNMSFQDIRNSVDISKTQPVYLGAMGMAYFFGTETIID